MKKLVFVLGIICVCVPVSNGEFIEMSQYHRMPKLWKMDDYEECLESAGPEEPESVYCTSTVVLKPDNRSDLWRLIDDFSKDHKRNFNHRVLKRGVCMKRCQKTIATLTPSERNSLMVDKFPIDVPYKFDETIFKNSDADRAMYEEMVEICINKDLNETYGLLAYAEVQTCDKSSDELEIDALDMSFVIVLVLLISLVIISSWYDSTINYKQNPDHYKQTLESKRKMVWVSFSVQRNWYRLTSRSQEELNKSLRFLQAFRFMTMFLVIFGHAMLLFALTPTTHPEKYEKLMHSIGSMILTNGVQITQTFLAMSGTLLAIQFLDFAEKRKGKISFFYVPIAIVYRYVRLTPVYAFVILLHATWLLKLHTGPLWRMSSETEQMFCRSHWWTNLLYINNYVYADQPCVQQGWYLGAEFQIFIIALIVLVAIVRFPRAKVLIVTVVLAAGYIVPGLFIYYQKLEGTFVITLEAQRYILWFDKFYLNSYIPSHINFGNYMLGVLTGLIFMELRRQSINLAENRTFRVIWYMNFLVIPLSMLPSYMFYVYDFETPSAWMAAYFVITKNLFGIGFCVLVLGCIYGINRVLLRILNSPIFEQLGRLAYGAYLIHPFVMRYMFGSARGPVYYTDILALSLVAGATVTSCVMSLVLCLLVELPTSALQNQLFAGFKGRKPNNRIESENVNINHQTSIAATVETDK